MVSMMVTESERTFLLNRRLEQDRQREVAMLVDLLNDTLERLKGNGVKMQAYNLSTGEVQDFRDVRIDRYFYTLNLCYYSKEG